MSVLLELKKVKRTGLIPAFLAGGILAGAVPILEMSFRSAQYKGLRESPLAIIFNADWQMMAMLNVLLIVVGACLMYHTEYADHAMQKMRSLPMKESTMFFSKSALLAVMLMVVLVIEAAALTLTSLHWFSLYDSFWLELGKNFGCLWFMSLPSVVLPLVISSICKNMWVSLGIGVVCVFTATMLPTTNTILSMFPFSLPFQTLGNLSSAQFTQFMVAAAVEIVVFSAIEMLIIRARRLYE